MCVVNSDTNKALHMSFYRDYDLRSWFISPPDKRHIPPVLIYRDAVIPRIWSVCNFIPIISINRAKI